MIRKMIPVFTAAAISMSITFVVPVAITAVSSFTFVSEAQAFGGFKSITKGVKKAAKKTKRVVKKTAKKTKRVAKRKYKQTKKFICPSGKLLDNGFCGRAVDPNTLRRVRERLTPRIGDPVRGTKDSRDHRTAPSGVAISYNPLRWR